MVGVSDGAGAGAAVGVLEGSLMVGPSKTVNASVKSAEASSSPLFVRVNPHSGDAGSETEPRGAIVKRSPSLLRVEPQGLFLRRRWSELCFKFPSLKVGSPSSDAPKLRCRSESAGRDLAFWARRLAKELLFGSPSDISGISVTVGSWMEEEV